MTSHDLRDVMNLPADHAAGPRLTKKQRTSAPRPNLKGLAREVQNLGGDNPIAIVPEVPVFKKRRAAIRKPAAKWILKPFYNSARADDKALVLHHWKRKIEHADLPDGVDNAENAASGDGRDAPKADVNGIEDSAFAKFNVQVDVPQYNDEQYDSNLQNADWSKSETDYLLKMAKEFDLRWTIVWDRYDFRPYSGTGNGEEDEDEDAVMITAPKPRSIEDLKARYYEVAHKMMAVQKPAQYMTRPEFELYETMQKFNPQQEALRKQFALNTLGRSKEEAREEESLLLEVKRILARTERFNEERRELYQRLDYPTSDTDVSQFKSSAGLQSLLQNLMNVDKSKKRKSVVGLPGSDGASPGGIPIPGSAVQEGGPQHRRESVAASVGGHRDSVVGTPSEPMSAAQRKKGAQLPERRKLSEQEEKVYGVSQHDRLTSGPTFRYEKINKLYSHKSGQQQTRITNVLRELGIPDRLFMPTAAVVTEFEQLWTTVTGLVDMRKVSDKLDNEIKIEEAKKAEKAKHTGSGTAAKVQPPGSNGPQGQFQARSPGLVPPASAPQGSVSMPLVPASTASGGPAGMPAPAPGPAVPEAKTANHGDEAGQSRRPSTSGSHKRSASVLSAASDKSAKRLKK